MKDNKRIEEIINVLKLAKEFASFLACEKLNLGKKDIIKKVVADIACDHGYIGLSALENKIADRVIFTDISEKSLEKARNLINGSEFLQFSEFRVGDGLEVLNENIFASIIAGIGGREIVKILKSSKFKLSEFYILQTSQDDVFLRQSLKQMNLSILFDKCIFATGHVYHTFLVATKNDKNKSDAFDNFALNYFIKLGEIPKNLEQKDIDFFKCFESDFYGKNNLFIGASGHKENINFQIDRYKNLLQGAIKTRNQNIENLSKSENNTKDSSIDNFISTLKSRLVALDKIYKSIL